MIIERTGRNKISVRVRDSNGKRITETHTCQPFFYIEDIAVPLEHSSVLRYETGYEGVYGESLTKVYTKTPEDIYTIRQDMPHLETWEANVPYVNRALVDNNVLPENYNHRVWYLDCEWSIRTGKLTIMVVYDTFSNEYYVFFTHPDYKAGFYDTFPCKNHPDGIDELHIEGKPAIAFSNEKSMLKAFAKHLVKQDPDVITGWNVVNADLQKIIKRFQANGLDPRTLSPINRVRYNFGDWAQPIGGINTIDMMIAFTRLWTIKNGQLPNKSLATVSSECLQETKVELEEGHETYYTDFGTYLDYSIQDVRLLPKLNSLNNCIEHYIAIQHIVGCDIRTTPFITKIFTILALRDNDFNLQIPTKPQFEYEPYEGASIEIDKVGVFDNVAILDIRAMYHSNVDLHNIGHETLDKQGKDCGNGVCFSQGKPSLLLRQMDKMTVLRQEYKEKLKTAKTKEEKNRYDSLQFATKSLVASIYGAAGDSKYGLYHPKVAAAITYTSRMTLQQLREECENEGFEVLYSHTDSAFVIIPTPEQGVELTKLLNKKMYPIENEFEKWCKSLLLKAKNRYAGIVTWGDGEYQQPELYVKGIELKQSRMFPVVKQVLSTTINNILDDKDNNEKKNTELVVETIQGILDEHYPLQDLCMKGNLKKDLSKYKVLSGVSAGAKWANDNLGKGYRNGSDFLVTLDSNGDYIAFDEVSEIEGFADIGYHHIIDRFIVKKIEPYYQVADWEIQPIYNALHGIPTVGFI